MTRRVAAVLGVAAAGAQAGHLIAYQLRFGASAMAVQSSGAHAYFPAVLKTALGAVALVALVALMLIGFARVLARGQATRVISPSYLTLLATLFTLQLAWFAGQEVVESLLAGASPASASHLLLWGMVGQLPVAAGGAAVLRWFWTRVEAAARELAAIVVVGAPAIPAPILVPVAGYPERALALVHSSRRVHVKRGPPASFSISVF